MTIYRTIDLDPNKAVGIVLPITNGNLGYFKQSFYTIDQVGSNLKNLILTSKGEKIMQPNLGCDLRKKLFEQISDGFESDIKQTIIDAVNYWLPFLSIDSIDVEQSEQDEHKINISIKFSMKNNPDINSAITFDVGGGV